MLQRKHWKLIVNPHRNFFKTILSLESWPIISNLLPPETVEQKLTQDCAMDSEDTKNSNKQQPVWEEWGKGNGRSYLCWRAEGDNSNFRSGLRIWKCDRTDSCQAKPHDSNLWFVSNPWLPCGAACCPTFFTNTSQATKEETGCLGGCHGVTPASN